MPASLLIASLLLSSVVPVAGSAPGPALDPDVVIVTSALWPDAAPGSLRILVVERGEEHVSSEVHAQWLQPDGDGPRSRAIASSRELVAAGLHRIETAALGASGPTLQLVLSGRRTYEPDIAVHCVFALSASGDARTLDPCGD